MRVYASAFQAALNGAVDGGLVPAWFLWVQARDIDSEDPSWVGLWTGDHDLTVTVAPPGGSDEVRTYSGGVAMSVDAVPLGVGLEDRPVSVALSQIAPAVQNLLRTLNARHAYCELHSGLFNRGALLAPPQIEYVGIVDVAQINTPPVLGEGSVVLSIRDEMLTQLSAINPAKSSDAHQKRRQAADAFSVYSGVIGDRDLQWYRR